MSALTPPCDPQCPNGGPGLCLLETAQRRLKMQNTGRALLQSVRRMDLNFREYQIAEMILELSYGWGMESVIIPSQALFTALTGVAKPHVSTNLHALREMKILLVEEVAAGTRYQISAQPDDWRCRPKISRTDIREAIIAIKMHNKLDDSNLPPMPNEGPLGFPCFFKPDPDTQNSAVSVTASVSATEEEVQKSPFYRLWNKEKV